MWKWYVLPWNASNIYQVENRVKISKPLFQYNLKHLLKPDSHLLFNLNKP